MDLRWQPLPARSVPRPCPSRHPCPAKARRTRATALWGGLQPWHFLLFPARRACRACRPRQPRQLRSQPWRWWGAESPEEWPDLLNSLLAEAKVLLKDFFGHEQYRPQQEEMLRVALQRKDMELYWATAAGKSLVFQLLALLAFKRRRSIVLVVEPTIPVMQDQVQQFNARAKKSNERCSACLLGSAQESAEVPKQAINGEYCSLDADCSLRGQTPLSSPK
ncbi:unnamed protein product [Effrenium voratum]|nr:unnamed protein product [Effrenium voratum]